MKLIDAEHLANSIWIQAGLDPDMEDFYYFMQEELSTAPEIDAIPRDFFEQLIDEFKSDPKTRSGAEFLKDILYTWDDMCRRSDNNGE